MISERAFFSALTDYETNERRTTVFTCSRVRRPAASHTRTERGTSSSLLQKAIHYSMNAQEKSHLVNELLLLGLHAASELYYV